MERKLNVEYKLNWNEFNKLYDLLKRKGYGFSGFMGASSGTIDNGGPVNSGEFEKYAEFTIPEIRGDERVIKTSNELLIKIIDTSFGL